MESLELHDTPLCSARLGHRKDIANDLFWSDWSLLQESTSEQLERDVRDLARKLFRSKTLEFGLLNCKGFIRHCKQISNPGQQLLNVTMKAIASIVATVAMFLARVFT